MLQWFQAVLYSPILIILFNSDSEPQEPVLKREVSMGTFEFQKPIFQLLFDAL